MSRLMTASAPNEEEPSVSQDLVPVLTAGFSGVLAASDRHGPFRADQLASHVETPRRKPPGRTTEEIL